MGIPVMIMGESGSGKTYSLKNLNPDQVAILLCEKSRLPFRKKFPIYKVRNTVNDKGQIIRQSQIVYSLLRANRRKIYVIDDSQYLMINEYFDRVAETGYQKYTEIGSHFRDIIHVVNEELPDDVIVYFLHHSDADSSSGKVRAKTVGRLLDDKLTLEGCFDIVLRTGLVDGQYVFNTQTDGLDTTKSPEDMFPAPQIPNDLALVDQAIRAYYDLPPLPESSDNQDNPVYQENPETPVYPDVPTPTSPSAPASPPDSSPQEKTPPKSEVNTTPAVPASPKPRGRAASASSKSTPKVPDFDNPKAPAAQNPPVSDFADPKAPGAQNPQVPDFADPKTPAVPTPNIPPVPDFANPKAPAVPTPNISQVPDFDNPKPPTAPAPSKGG